MINAVAVFLAMPLSALAAEPAVQAVAPQATAAASSGMGGQIVQLLFGLLLVVGLIFLLARLMRRVQRGVPGNTQVIELVGSRAIGPRDRGTGSGRQRTDSARRHAGTNHAVACAQRASAGAGDPAG